MNIVIIGSSGFVGKNLSDYLKNDIKIKHINRNDIQFVVPSVFDQNEAIIHLAGKAHDLKKTSDPNDYYQINYELTKKMYDVFLTSSAKKFIFVSSVKAASDKVVGTLFESIDPDPQTPYGRSKLMAEEYISKQPLPAGKSYYILRPCMIHGPGNKGNLNLLYKFVKKGIPYPLAGFNNKRSFLSIKNLCFVIQELVKRDDILAGIYNVADDEPLSTNEVVSILSYSLNVKPKLWQIAPGIIKTIAKVGDLLHLPLTTERLNKLTESYVVSNKKIKKALNMELPLSSVKGLELTAVSFNGSDL